MAEFIHEYAALESRIAAAIRDDLGEDEFAALALDVHAFQRNWNEPYARLCAASPEPRTWQEIPAVPQAMFKRFRVSCVPKGQVGLTFRTSGTTGETRGEHHFLNTKLYDGAALAGWLRLLRPPASLVMLSMHPEDAPDSSLSHMLGMLERAVGGGHASWWLDESGQLVPEAIATVTTVAASGGNRVGIFGTALGFLNLFEFLGARRLVLPPDSFAVETGGFKGSGREIAKAELYAMFDDRLGLASHQIWNEYGMCELSSQFYARGLGGEHTGGRWVRGQVVSPETGREVAVDEAGVLKIFDLANLGSVLAIQTADFAIRRERGFELLGRDPGATPRGCSRPADEALQRSATSDDPQFRPVPARVVSVAARRHIPQTASTLAARLPAIAAAASHFPFLGEITADTLRTFVATELGHADALDDFVPCADHRARAIPPGVILHILSGNTPAAALQSLIRGLLLGSRNLCKLPSAGLPEVEAFIAALPPDLAALIESRPDLPDEWLADSDAIVVFGDDATVSHFRSVAQSWQIFVAHGHKLSFGIVFDDPSFSSAAGAARDASVFDQQGCLSPHVFFVRESDEFTARAYAGRLAHEMAVFEKDLPRQQISLSEANAIRTLREELSFRAANGEPVAVFASADTAWTVVVEDSSGFPRTPLNRVIFVKPLPADLVATLGSVQPHLATCGIWPCGREQVDFAVRLGVERICAIGKMQSPPLTWHQDGQSSLSPLVRWIDWES